MLMLTPKSHMIHNNVRNSENWTLSEVGMKEGLTSCVRVAWCAEQGPWTHDSSIEAERDPEQAGTVPGCQEEFLWILPRFTEVQVTNQHTKTAEKEDHHWCHRIGNIDQCVSHICTGFGGLGFVRRFAPFSPALESWFTMIYYEPMARCMSSLRQSVQPWLQSQWLQLSQDWFWTDINKLTKSW